MKKGKFYCGTSNIVLPVTKIHFPPEYRETSRLAYYASVFNSLEVNSSFYKNPLPATVVKWAESVPAHFRFTFKLSKEITHVKGLQFIAAHVSRFMHVIDGANSKKGCLLIQFPGSLQFEKINEVYKLLDLIMEADPEQRWQLVVEFRHSSWYNEETYEMLNEYNATLVMHDMPKSHPPVFIEKAKCVFQRFHGIAGDYRGSYSDASLSVYAAKVHKWLAAGMNVYAYFNNTLGDAYNNALSLSKFVAT